MGRTRSKESVRSSQGGSDDEGDGDGQQQQAFLGGKVTVVVWEARDLVAMDKGKKGEKGTSDPFVRILSGGLKGRQQGKTSHVTKSLEPKWDSDNEFSFVVRPSEPEVAIEVLDYDGPMGSADSMGYSVTNLMTEYGSGEPVTDWFDLMPTGRKAVTGSVKLTVTFVPETPTPEGALHIQIHQARDLAAMDRGKKGQAGTSDPFFRVFRESVLLKDPKTIEVGRTETVKKNVNPEFGDLSFFKFDVGSVHNEIIIEGYDYDGPVSSTSLGQVILPIKQFTSGEPVKQWFDLGQAPKSNTDVTGAVEATIEFKPWTPFPEGTFTMKLHGAKELIAMDKGGTSDPFVKVFLENRKRDFKSRIIYSSQVVKKTVDPTFDEKVRFGSVRTDKEVILEVLDKDAMSEASLGEVVVTTEQLMKVIEGEEMKELWLELSPTREMKRKSISGKAKPQTGHVQISLSFLPWVPNPEGTLKLTVLEARGLAATDKGRKGQPGTSDPYTKVFLNDRRKQNKSNLLDRTNTVKKSLEPKWNQPMKCDTMSFHNEIIFECFDEDRTSSESLGEAIVLISSLVERKSFTDWIPLEPVNKKSIGQGEIQVQFDWEPWTPQHDGTLEIRVVSGRGLIAMDKQRKGPGTSDPFCNISLEKRNGKPKKNLLGKTPTIKKSLTPTWNFRAETDILPHHKSVIIEVYDEDKMGDNDTMGQCEITLKEMSDPSSKITETRFLPLVPAGRNDPGQGEIEVAWHFEPWLDNREGSFNVRVVECSGLRATDRGGTSDPFVTIFCENRNSKARSNKVFKSEVVKKTVDPVWHNQVATWQVNGADKGLTIEVSDYDGPMSSESLGFVYVELKDLAQGEVDEWFELQSGQGKIHLVMWYEGEQEPEEAAEEAEEAEPLDFSQSKVCQTNVELCVRFCRGLLDETKQQGRDIATAIETARATGDQPNCLQHMELAVAFVNLAKALENAWIIVETTQRLTNKAATTATTRLADAIGGQRGADASDVKQATVSALKGKVGRQVKQHITNLTLETCLGGLAVYKQQLTNGTIRKIEKRRSELEAVEQEALGVHEFLKRRVDLFVEMCFAGLETDDFPPLPLREQYRDGWGLLKGESGTVAKEDVWLLLVSVGDPEDPKKLPALLESISQQGLTEEEFLKLMDNRYATSATRESTNAFLQFDADGSGTIDPSELGVLMKNLGVALEDKEIEHMVAHADTVGEGELSFEDFTSSI